MARLNYLILTLIVTLGSNVIVCNGFDILSFISNIISNFKSNKSDAVTTEAQEGNTSIPSPIRILDLVTPTSVCISPPVSCSSTRYRSLDGSCNNLNNTGWGTPNSTYGRLIPSNYGDGISSFAKKESGDDLPNARETSFELFPPSPNLEKKLNLLGMQYGQIIAHDMSLTSLPSQICCANGNLTSDASNTTICAAIIIPENDPIHKAGSCLDFERTITARDIGCAPSNEPGQQLTIVTAFMDASILYGNTDEQSATLRTFENGLLIYVTNNSEEWPPQAPNVTEACPGADSPSEPCFLGGDIRMNQSPELTLLQVALLRYHNAIATEMSALNPCWDDDKIFQEVRSIVIAVLQNINYYEYFVLLLGEKNMLDNKLIYERNESNLEEYINDYNDTVDPTVLNEHATAAYRYFHTLIYGHLDLVYENRLSAGSIRLSDWYDRPKILEENDNYDKLTRGMTKQASSCSDRYFDAEITEYLFRYKNKYGSDLRAITIQRGRDHGLGTYVSARAALGLSVPKTFNDLHGLMYEDVIPKLEKLYGNVSNIDLTVGGSLELHVPGTLVGPVFLILQLEQLYRTRVGDRYFFENGSDEAIRFEPAQLKSIRNVKIASVLCCSSDIKSIQRQAFEQISLSNPLVSCDDIPKINVTLWKDKTSCDKSN